MNLLNWLKASAKDSVLLRLDPSLLKRVARKRMRGKSPTSGAMRGDAFAEGMELLEPRQLLSDTVAPTVLSITPIDASGLISNSRTNDYTVTFSESVTGVDASDFALAFTGTANASVQSVTKVSASVYTVDIGAITGEGAIGMHLATAGSIKDLAGNALDLAIPLSFSPQATFAAGFRPYNIAIGDLNNDGKPDAVITSNSKSLGVMLGNGNGTFQAPTTFAADTQPFSIALGDLNGDGNLDAVVANLAGNDVSVLLGKGDGTFQAQTTYAADAFPTSVALGDVNGDGKPDILVANQTTGTNIGVRLGNGDGTFQAQATFATYFPARSLAVIDLNGDGRLDVVTGEGANGMGVLLGNGDGTFAAETVFATAGGTAFSVAVADVNGDGKPDGIVTNYGYYSISVLLGNGDGTFQAQASFATGNFPHTVKIGDMNGDGKPDAIVLNYTSDNISVLLGNGDGTFQARKNYATDHYASSLAIGDVTGDGRPDVLVADRYTFNLGVILNTGKFAGVLTVDNVSPSVTSIDRTNPAGTVAGGTAVFTATFGEAVTGVDTADFRLAFTGGAYGEIDTVTKISASVYTVSVKNITGDGGTLGLNLVDNNSIRDAAGNPLVNPGSTASFSAWTSFTVGQDPYSVALGDVNGDGKPDAVVMNITDASLSVLLGNGNGTFQAQMTFAVGAVPLSVALGDLNGDGRPDAVVTSQSGSSLSVLLGNGDGTFQAQTTFATGNGPHTVVLGDVNGDGRLDALVVNTVDSSVSVLLGKGDGTFQMQTTFGTGDKSITIALGDVNGDGRPDALMASYDNDVVDVLLGNGDGTFHAPATSSFATGSGPFRIALGDVNADGRPDALIANLLSNNISVLLGNGDGTFQGQTTFATDDLPSSVALSDVNGDGRPDALVTSLNISTIDVLLGNGDGTFQAQTTFATSGQPIALNVGDLNGDGRPDALFADSTGGTISALLNIANGNFTGQVYTIDTVAPKVVSINRTTPSGTVAGSTAVFTATFNEAVTGVDVSDFALATTGGAYGTIASVTAVSSTVYTITVNNITGNDGTLGLNLVDNNTIRDTAGNPLVNLNEAASFSAQTTLATNNYSISVSLGDLNGDGTLDAVVVNVLARTMSVFLGNGDGTFQTLTPLATGNLPKGVVLGDVNGDGKLDALVSNYHGDTVSLFLGNGDGSFQTRATFAAGSSTPYAVALGDVNGDGKPDALVTNYDTYTMSVLLGNGNGTFQEPTTFPLGGYPVSLKLGDVNDDGRLDALVTNRLDDTMGVLLGNGDGSFQPQAIYATGDGPSSIALGDVNGDGKPDALVTNAYESSISVLLGNGNGTFQASMTYAVGQGPYSVALSDVNGDGRPDAVVAIALVTGTMDVLLGNGDGTFQAPATFAANTGSHDVAVAIGDFNDDGRPDAFVSGLDLLQASVLLNTVNGDFTGQVYTIDTVAPNVMSIDRTTPVGPGSGGASTLIFTATFNESVTGVDTTDFKLALTGTGAGTITAVTPVSESVYTITVGSVSGSGTLGLNLADDNTIRDAAGNPLANPGSAASFAAQATSAVGVSFSVAVGDVNGDGKLDAVAAIADSGSISVLLGNGDGTFEPQATFAAGGTPWSVVLYDVDGDNLLDAIVNNLGSNSMSVLLGNGDGTFQPQTTFALGNAPNFIAVGDVNGDGRPDAVVADYTGYVGVLLGNGDGTFQPQTTFLADSGSVTLALSDVNGDNKPDVLVANFISNSLSVLLGNGDGTFQAQTTYATGTNPFSIAVGDMNDDGKPDAIVTNYDNSVSVLPGNGNGTFQTQTTFATGADPRAVVLGDVNGDGKPDILTANDFDGTVSVLLGNGNGTFQPQTTFVTGSLPKSIALGDMNGDGRPDVVVANINAPDDVLVLLNTVNGNFTGQVYTIDTIAPNVVSIDRTTPVGPGSGGASTLTFTATFSESVTGVDTTDFKLALTGTGAGTITSVTPGSGSVYTITVGSVSGSGTLGLNLADDSTIRDVADNLLTSAGSVTFSAQATFAAGNAPMAIALGDVNGDGKADAVIANRNSTFVSVLLGNGDGTFQSQATFVAGPGPDSVALGDVNEDGKLDIIVANYNGRNVSVLLGNGNGTFQAAVTYATGIWPRGVVLADVNGDGKLDALVANSGSENMGVLLGNGDGTFQAQATFAAGDTPYSVVLGDLNGDGKPDAIIANRYDDNMSVLLGNGNGTFQGQTTFATGTDPYSLALGDVNGDGRADALVTNLHSDSVSLLLGDGNGAFQARTTFATGKYPSSSTIGDVNGDGRPDIIAVNYGNNSVGVLLGNGDGTFRTQTTFATDSGPLFVALGDVNGDGEPDVLVANGDSDNISVLLNTTNGDFTGQIYTLNTTPVLTSNGGGDSASISIAENIAAVTTVTATDAEAPPQTLTYSISGTDAVKFTINTSTGVLTFITAPDYEVPTDAGTNNVYDVMVQVSDSSLTDTQAIAVTVTPVNDNSPVITSNGGGTTATVSIAENASAVTTVVATDADLPVQTLTYTILVSTDSSAFTINTATGAITFVTAPNFEAPTDTGTDNIYDVTVQVSDGTYIDTQAIAVTVLPVNDNSPVITSNGAGTTATVSIPENTAAVTTVTATDADLPAQALTYSIIGGADASAFAINTATGALTFVTAPNFESPTDSGTDNTYDVVVKATDGIFSDSQAIAVTITNVNETPTDLTLSPANLDENQPIGTTIGAFSTADPDAGNTFTYTLVTGSGGSDNASFTIDGTGHLKSSAVFNYEAKHSYTVRVRTTDQGGLYTEKAFTITVNNANDAPTDIALSATQIAENAPTGTTIGTFTSSDPDLVETSVLAGDTFTYTLVSGDGDDDNAGFTIDGSGHLKSALPFDFEAKSSYSIRVRSTDAGGLYFEKQFTITVTNVNETPTSLALSPGVILENQPVGTVVGFFSTTDPDAGNTFTYSLVSGTGSDDNASFTISANGLKTAAIFDSETKSSYTIRVRTTDQGGLSTEQAFTISVSNLNEAPTLTTVSDLAGATEDSPFTITFAALSAAANEADVDTAVLSFRIESITSGTLTKNGVAVTPGVTLLGTGESLVWTPASNVNGTLGAFTIKAFDGDLYSSTAVPVSVVVTPVNDAPTLTTVAALTGASEDTPFTITYATLLASANEADIDSATLSFRVESVTSGTLTKNGVAVTPGGTLLGTGESLVWTPASNANGTLAAFTVVAFDGELASGSAVPVSVVVAPVNDVPTLSTIGLLTGASEDTPFTITYATLLASANEADIDSATLSFRVESVVSGTLTKAGVAIIPGSTILGPSEELVWTPDADDNGIFAAFTVKAFDGTAASGTAVSVSIDVTPVNDAPTLTSMDTLDGAIENKSFTITYADLAAAGDQADIDSGSLSFRIESITGGTLTRNGGAVAPGTTIVGPDDELRWTPGADTFGTQAAFTVKAFDGELASGTPVQVSVDVERRYTYDLALRDHKYVFPDSNGTVVTVKLTGKSGVLHVVRDAPEGERGDLLELTADGTDATTSISITVGRKLSTNIFDVFIPGAIKSFNAPAGIFHNDLQLGGANTVKLGHAPDLDLTSTGPIGKLTLVDWIGGSLNAPAVNGLKTTGLKGTFAGDFSADITLTRHDASAFTLGTFSVAGAFSHSTLTSAGSINAITVGSMVDSNIYIDTIVGLGGLASSAADFNSHPADRTLIKLTVKGIIGGPSFVDSVIDAWKIGSLDLKTVDTTNGGVPLGIAADAIASVKFIAPSVNSNNAVKLTQLESPADLSNPSNNPAGVAFPVGDFRLTLL